MEYLLQDYIDNRIEKTYDPNDKILACCIQYDVLLIAKNNDIHYSCRETSKFLLKDTNIKRKVSGGSQYYTGLKYKNKND
jgi:hypothetical protein